jgi:hypothetical protein
VHRPPRDLELAAKKTLRRLSSCSFLPLLLVLLAGCTTPEATDYDKYKDMDSVEKAKLISKLRKQADSALERFRISDGDLKGVDFAALEEYTRLQRETTLLYSPAECPPCYENYGQGLYMEGVYYLDLRKALEKELAKAPPASQEELAAKARKYESLAHDRFRLSLRQLEQYLRSGTVSLNLRVYQFASQMYAELRDYNRAIHYLDLFAQQAPLTEQDKIKVNNWRLGYERENERQRQREFEEELRDGRSLESPRSRR